jgi:hypothetical protein
MPKAEEHAFSELRPSAEVAAALDLGDTGMACLLHQILSYDDEPVEFW